MEWEGLKETLTDLAAKGGCKTAIKGQWMAINHQLSGNSALHYWPNFKALFKR